MALVLFGAMQREEEVPVGLALLYSNTGVFDCSISPSPMTPFSISQHFNPRLNALWQIGSSEHTLVRLYGDKLVHRARLLRNGNKEHFNLEH